MREKNGLPEKTEEELSEDEKIALLGKPRLGEVCKAQIRIKESREFKVSALFSYKKCYYFQCSSSFLDVLKIPDLFQIESLFQNQ